tara:strand:- start:95 stop:508 length:414 start_codon:yes stop_codon:yes gene_type:complete
MNVYNGFKIYTSLYMDINKKYVPDSLSSSDKTKQIKSIKAKTDRPILKSAKTKRSSHVVNFENKYGYKINELTKVYKNIISKTGVDKIIDKGMGAYYSSGSRPNVSARQWAYARLASVIMGGGARAVDKDIWLKYKV